VPPVPVPPEIDAFLSQPNPAVVGTVRPDGAPHTAPTWYDWEDGKILLNMEDTRSRLDHLRRESRVSISVLDKDGWYHHVTLLGQVVSLEQDPDMSVIDRLSRRYTGQEYSKRDRPRFSAWVQPDSWHEWPART
jgi:PPOX class probable F420-dependent enzyme